MSGFGESGFERDCMVYGSFIDALLGVVLVNGVFGGGLMDFLMLLFDLCAGIYIVIVMFVAFFWVWDMGVGEWVECLMFEVLIVVFFWLVLY